MALKVQINSSKSGYYELTVKSICSSIKHCDDIDSARRSFQYDLERIPKRSTGSADVFYKATEIINGFEVWHLNAIGDKDRLVATITND